MNFIIDTIDQLAVTDQQIVQLLHEVYVDGNFTSAEVAKTVFEPQQVKQRGTLFVARATSTQELAGMIILVPATSQAAVRAKQQECEIHLLAVRAAFRGQGLGRALVSSAIDVAISNHYSKIILWTQRSMTSAQSLYRSFGFAQTDTMSKNNIDFLVYEKYLEV